MESPVLPSTHKWVEQGIKFIATKFIACNDHHQST